MSIYCKLTVWDYWRPRVGTPVDTKSERLDVVVGAAQSAVRVRGLEGIISGLGDLGLIGSPIPIAHTVNPIETRAHNLRPLVPTTPTGSIPLNKEQILLQVIIIKGHNPLPSRTHHNIQYSIFPKIDKTCRDSVNECCGWKSILFGLLIGLALIADVNPDAIVLVAG